MDGVGVWASWYRLLPHRFAVEYFGMTWLTTLQKIILNIIVKWNYAMIIASRGWGKSQIVAAAVCIVATLYPGVIITVASGVRKQSTNLLEKIIMQFMPQSPNLQNEIDEYRLAGNEAYIRWKNGSIVNVATARASARSERTNWLIADEFVQIKKTVLDSVLRKFKAGERTPGFFSKPEYKNTPKEPNRETYISSAYYKYHYAWDKFKTFFKNMLRNARYFCCGIPYQLPVYEGYYPLQQVIDEMSEADFDSIKWSMEMESLFFGQAEDAFFAFTDFEVNRSIPIPNYPPHFYKLLGDAKLKPKPKLPNEVRICCSDIATQGGDKNDNSCFVIMSIDSTKDQFIRSVIYMETMNGGHTYNQAIKIRQLCDDFDCDYVVIDAAGVGAGVFDALVRDLVDEERGCVYRAWSCVNDEAMAARCNDIEAPKKIYAIKATLQFNSEAAILLRDTLKRGKIQFLYSETEGMEYWNSNPHYLKLSVEDQVLFQAPYYQTSMLINEAINLSYAVVNGNIRVSERGSARKDRYTAVSYANYIAAKLEREGTLNQNRSTANIEFKFKKPQLYSRAGRW